MKRNLCIFKGILLAVNENEKKEKKKNFERLRNNRVLNEVLGNSFAFLFNWKITIKSANLAKTFLKLIHLKQNT